MDASRSLLPLALAGGLALALGMLRLRARARRGYMRLRVSPYRTDRATAEAVVAMFDALHKRLLQRWWRRLILGQPSVALEAHLLPRAGGGTQAALAVSCPVPRVAAVQAALRSAYPNTLLESFGP